jgi:20S proteasome alpha/beta subunit
VAGLLADAKQIVETARSECADYRQQYGSDIPLKVCKEVDFLGKMTSRSDLQ